MTSNLLFCLLLIHHYVIMTAVRSGDYYLFDDPASEDAEIDLEDKPRKSLIPDPEGDELRRIANLRGISAVSSL